MAQPRRQSKPTIVTTNGESRIVPAGQNPLGQLPDTIMIGDAAEFLGCSASTVVNRIAEGEIIGWQIGKAWKVERQSVLDYVERQKAAAQNIAKRVRYQSAKTGKQKKG